jgi:hypothetical protein
MRDPGGESLPTIRPSTCRACRKSPP